MLVALVRKQLVVLELVEGLQVVLALGLRPVVLLVHQLFFYHYLVVHEVQKLLSFYLHSFAERMLFLISLVGGMVGLGHVSARLLVLFDLFDDLSDYVLAFLV